MEEKLIHKEGPFHFMLDREGKIRIDLPDGHGPKLSKDEVRQLSRGARFVAGSLENAAPYPGPVCRHRCRTCDEVWTHDPEKLECRWAYDDLCGDCAGMERTK